LTINGGSKGILVITGSGRSICKSAQTGSGLLGAHSGEDESLTIPFGTPCNSKAKKTHGHKQNKRKHAQKKLGRR
jgi:hypothetical protein